MTSRFGSWLAGGSAAGPRPAQENGPGTQARNGTPKQDQSGDDHPGARYGLRAAGPGSAGGLGRRLVALLVDCVLAALITSLFVRPGSLQPTAVQDLNSWSLLTWFVITVIGTGFFAATPGMMLLGLRVARIDGAAMVLPLRAALRAVLVAVVLPAVIWDGDKRGLHDKAAGTIVVSSR